MAPQGNWGEGMPCGTLGAHRTI